MNLEVFVLGTGGMMPLPGKGPDLGPRAPGRGAVPLRLRRGHADQPAAAEPALEEDHQHLHLPHPRRPRHGPARASSCSPPRWTGTSRCTSTGRRRSASSWRPCGGPWTCTSTTRSWCGRSRAERAVVKAEDYRICSHSLVHTKPCLAYSLEENAAPGHLPSREGAGARRAARPAVVAAAGRGGRCSLPDGGTVHARARCMGDAAQGPQVLLRHRHRRRARAWPSSRAGSDLFICEGMFAEELADDRRGEEAPHRGAGGAHRPRGGGQAPGPDPLQPALLRARAEDAPGRGAGDLPGVLPHAGPAAHRAAVRGLPSDAFGRTATRRARLPVRSKA